MTSSQCLHIRCLCYYNCWWGVHYKYSDVYSSLIMDAQLFSTFRYYFTLCAHKKTRLYLFLINVFWCVDSKSAIRFFGRYWKTPIIRKKQKFLDCWGFPASDWKNGLQHLFRQGTKPFLIPRQFGKLQLIQRSTETNPEYQLYFIIFMPISAGMVDASHARTGTG